MLPSTAMVDTVQIRDALDQLARLLKTLSADVQHAFREAIDHAQQGKEEESQRSRRNAARALFALMEGMVYGMKQAAYEFDQLLGLKTFGRAEIAFLREEEYTLQDNGKARVRPARLRTQANLRFAFEALTRAFRSRVSSKPQGEGWEAFGRALRLRHRLTHPKRADQLSVGDDELHDLVKARGWFSTTAKKAGQL